jgi:hypothetical protein
MTEAMTGKSLALSDGVTCNTIINHGCKTTVTQKRAWECVSGKVQGLDLAEQAGGQLLVERKGRLNRLDHNAHTFSNKLSLSQSLNHRVHAQQVSSNKSSRQQHHHHPTRPYRNICTANAQCRMQKESSEQQQHSKTRPAARMHIVCSVVLYSCMRYLYTCIRTLPRTRRSDM